jgi:hypothetical protein
MAPDIHLTMPSGSQLGNLTSVSSDGLARLMEQSVGSVAMILQDTFHSTLFDGSSHERNPQYRRNGFGYRESFKNGTQLTCYSYLPLGFGKSTSSLPPTHAPKKLFTYHAILLSHPSRNGKSPSHEKTSLSHEALLYTGTK